MNKYASSLRYGANQNTIKNVNRNLVLQVLNALGQASRTDIAKVTGLTKTSITNITTELIEQDIICEVVTEGENAGNMGRKPVMLDISPNSPCALGVSINRDFIYISLVNLRGDIILEDMLILHNIESKETFLEGIYGLCETCMAAAKAKQKRILGIGIASIGPLDIGKGMIVDPPNFKAIKGIKIVEALQKKFGLPVVLNNDMNACAISEKLFGRGKQVTNFVYLGVTNGIGAGVIANHDLLMGENGFTGEVGHISIDYRGKPCPCGNVGCLELYAGIPYIEERARELLRTQTSLLSTISSVRWHDIIDAAYKNDKLAHAVLDEMVEYLTVGMVSVANAYDPEVIYIGHELALAGRLIIEKLSQRVNGRVFSKHIQKVRVELSKYTDMMYRINGAALAVYEYFRGGLAEKTEQRREDL